MNWNYILFDLDGTLTEPKIGITKSFQYALQSFGIHEDNLDHLDKVIGPPLKQSFMEYYGLNEEQATQAIAKYRERFEVIGWKENALYEGIPELLASLKGKKLAIASSKPTVFVEKICKYFGIREYFHFIAGSNLDGTHCEKIDIIRTVYEQLDIGEKSQMIMVGDRKFDVLGGHEFGIQVIGVNYGYAQENELQNAGADYIVETVAELQKLLNK
ncbi:MAG: HAD-IA family hydrolase [Clostridium sp.]|nr:HAD-IA family hydrolase [Clostridium sp.]